MCLRRQPDDGQCGRHHFARMPRWKDSARVRVDEFVVEKLTPLFDDLRRSTKRLQR
jgi:hypothetical protein